MLGILIMMVLLKGLFDSPLPHEISKKMLQIKNFYYYHLLISFFLEKMNLKFTRYNVLYLYLYFHINKILYHLTGNNIEMIKSTVIGKK